MHIYYSLYYFTYMLLYVYVLLYDIYVAVQRFASLKSKNMYMCYAIK